MYNFTQHLKENTMKNKITIIFLTTIVINCTNSAYARKGPTWLFTVPTADTLTEGRFTVGWLHADIGFTNELEIGIHGVKYNLEHGTRTQTGLAIGVATFWWWGPYIVGSNRSDSLILHIGIKAVPSFLFAAAEIPMSPKNTLILEANDGFNIGVRRYINRRLTLDAGVSYTNFSIYQRDFYVDYPFGHYKRSFWTFDFSPIIGIAYSDIF
jgi:hypothetical protein